MMSEVGRHERAVWVPGMARHDSGEVGKCQVRKDLGCPRGGGTVEQRHGYEVNSVFEGPGGKGGVKR